MSWRFPLKNWNGFIPVGGHPGAFGAQRKHDVHTGVDLYVPEPCPVFAVEDGIVIEIEHFTGPLAESPWWLPTQAILIEGKSGVVCYGEVTAISNLRPGVFVTKGQELAKISPVLKEGKRRLDIPGHSRFMLHFELYDFNTTETVWWKNLKNKPHNLLDPTKKLLRSFNERQL